MFFHEIFKNKPLKKNEEIRNTNIYDLKIKFKKYFNIILTFLQQNTKMTTSSR